MKQLKVIAEFRDKSDFTLKHEVGDMLFIDDEKRVALLVRLGLCEVVGKVESEESEAESVVSDLVEETDAADSEAQADTGDVDEQPQTTKGKKTVAKETAKKTVTRKKKTA